jgi:hypothetical protein
MAGGMQTPWGVAQMRQQLDEGVFLVQTEEHGGLLIDADKARTLLSEKARKIGQLWNEFFAFEQDYDMMVVFYEHPEFYPWVEEELTLKFAEDSLHRYHPNYFTA